MNVTLTGNSHVWALRHGTAPPDLNAQVFGLGNGKYEKRPFSRIEGDRVHLTQPVYAQALKQATDLDALDGSRTWGICMVNHNSRVYRDETWLTYEPAAVRTDGHTAVSSGLLGQLIKTDQHAVRLFLDQLRQASVDFFVISAPPPRGDSNAIRKGVRREVVAHIDQSARMMWHEWLAERSIVLLDPPNHTVDADGFLLPEYNSDVVRNGIADRHHASAEYGTLVCEQVAQYLRTR